MKKITFPTGPKKRVGVNFIFQQTNARMLIFLLCLGFMTNSSAQTNCEQATNDFYGNNYLQPDGASLQSGPTPVSEQYIRELFDPVNTNVDVANTKMLDPGDFGNLINRSLEGEPGDSKSYTRNLGERALAANGNSSTTINGEVWDNTNLVIRFTYNTPVTANGFRFWNDFGNNPNNQVAQYSVRVYGPNISGNINFPNKFFPSTNGNSASSFQELAFGSEIANITHFDLVIQTVRTNSSVFQMREVALYKDCCENITNPASMPAGNVSFNNSFNPPYMNLAAASGGVGGNIAYQWQKNNGAGWQNISGATSEDYDPGTISQTTSYRRGARRDCDNSDFVQHTGARVYTKCAAINLECEYNINGGGWIKNCSVQINQGQSLSLSVNPNNLLKYQWTSPNGFSGIGSAGGDVLISNSVNASHSGVYTVEATNSSGCVESKNITVNVNTCANFTNAGSINGAQSYCGSYNPGNMSNTGDPSGGSGGGGTQYQWQISSNNSSWTDIPGATGNSYDPNTNISATTYYRRGAKRIGCSGNFIPTSVVTKSVNSIFTNPGSISGNQSGCVGYNPGNISNAGNPSGGSGGSTQYQWQMSPDNSSWTVIPSATGSSYDPDTNLSATTYYRRGAKISVCSANYIFTASVTKAVTANFTNSGSISGDESACGGYNPSNISSSAAPSGGSGGGTLYQWQHRTTGGWFDSPGANSTSYDPGSISQTTQYRRGARRSGCSDYLYTTLVTKTVTTSINIDNAGTMPDGDASFYIATSPFSPENMAISVATGGSGGSVVYQWQLASDTNNDGIVESFSDIPGATSASYNPENITRTTQYRRGSKRSCGSYNFPYVYTGNRTYTYLPIDAVDDNPAAHFSGETTTALVNVLTNDTFEFQQASTARLTLTQVSTTNTGISLNPATGNISVTASVLPGNYQVNYSIHETGRVANKDEAIVFIIVNSATVVANNEAALFNYEANGTNILNVLTNDLFNGRTPEVSDVTITLISTTNAGLTLDTSTGAISVTADVPLGVYELVYQICHANDLSNCDTATVTITVVADRDEDGVTDNIDIDDDNDGITDTVESNGNNPDGDEDGDGVLNYQDTADAGNGGDGSTTDYTDADNNNIPDVYDTDGDGVVNHFDLDADNDGIPDNVEAQSTTGYIAPTGTLGTNGLDAAYENNDSQTATGLTPVNTDNADTPDFLDLDSDNDNLFDLAESGLSLTDANDDGKSDGVFGFGNNGLDNNLETPTDNYIFVRGNLDDSQADNFLDADADVNSGGDVDYRDTANIHEYLQYLYSLHHHRYLHLHLHLKNYLLGCRLNFP